jgi:phenylacetate-CoA ligase
VGPIGQECEFHDGMHVNAECLHVEVEPQDGSEGSALGRILVTDLLNHGMPFVRYEIGDIGMLASRPCPCGRGLPRLQQMGGRLADATYTRDGRAISSIALVANLVHGLIWTRVQIIQEAFDRLQIRIEPPAPPAEILARQRSVAETIFGTPLEVTQEIVDRIPLEKSGKYRYIICKIPESQLERRRRGGSDPSAEGS